MKTEIKKTNQHGTTFYYNEKNRLHREDGLPAIEHADGYKSWFVNGKKVTEAEAKKMFAKPKTSAVEINIDVLNSELSKIGYMIVKKD